MKKYIRNVDVVIYRLGPVLTKVMNYRLEIIKEKKQRRKKWWKDEK